MTDRRWFAFAAFAGLTVLLYWPTVASIVGRWWNSPTYSSGLLIGPVSLWLTWRVARSGALDDARPAPLAAVLVLLAGFGWLVAKAGSVEVIQQLAIPALLLAGAWTLFGWRGFAALLVPIGILYFVIPAWDYVMPVLQALTVQVTDVCLAAMRIPAYIEGNLVTLPVGAFQIVEGCSGVHFFMTAGALAALYCHLYLDGFRRMALFSAVTLGLALLANWVRVTVVIVAGYLTEMQTFLVQVDHYYFGWVVFVLMMLPALWLGRRLEAPPGAGRTERAATGGTVIRGAAASTAALAAIVAAPVIWFGLTTGHDDDVAGLAMPERVGEWRRTGAAAPDWQPVQPGASVLAGQAYADGDTVIDVYVAYYPAQSDGRELVGYGNRLARPSDGQLRLREAGWAEISRGERSTRVIRYAYIVGGRVTPVASRAKVYQVIGTLTRRPEAMLVAVSARCEDDCETARQAIARFERAMSDEHGSLGGSISVARGSAGKTGAGA